MRFKAILPLAFTAVFLLSALSTGSPVLWMIAMLLFLSLALGGCTSSKRLAGFVLTEMVYLGISSNLAV